MLARPELPPPAMRHALERGLAELVEPAMHLLPEILLFGSHTCLKASVLCMLLPALEAAAERAAVGMCCGDKISPVGVGLMALASHLNQKHPAIPQALEERLTDQALHCHDHLSLAPYTGAQRKQPCPHGEAIA